MATDYSDAEKAEGKIQLMLQRLAGAYPFHVAVLQQFQVSARPEVGTMGVMVDGDSIALLHNPTFVLDTAAPELGGVLLHEVHHVVLKHVIADPADFPDEWARIVAEEVTVNEFVKEPLPPGGITLAMFPRLPPLESTRKRYERLLSVKRRIEISSPRGGGKPQSGQGGTGAGTSAPAPSGNTDTKSKSGQGGTVTSGTTSNHRGKDGSGRGGRREKAPATTTDDHSVWADAKNRAQGDVTIRNVVDNALLAVGLDQVPKELQPALAAAGYGLEPGDQKSRLDGDQRGSLRWRQLLRRYVGEIVEPQPVFNRPPRRFPEMLGIIPGRRSQAAKPKIMAVLDTSGSLTDELLEDVSAELASLARCFKVVVVECDVVIHRVYPYTGPLTEVCGRGGTSFRPPFKSKFLGKHHPNLIIYFTDGDGPAPAKAPRIPVIWCLVPDGETPVRWGRTVRMENK